MSRNLSYLEGWISIAVNLLLFAFKLYAGLVTSSIAMISDALHTLSDSSTSLIVVIGAKMASKPGDREHPFGHGRVELIASLIIGFLLLTTAGSLIFESVKRISGGTGFHFRPILVYACAATIVLKEALAQFSFWAYRKSRSLPLKADGWHHRTDAVSSVIVLAGILFGRYFWWIDGALGIVVGVMIGVASFSIMKDGINPLLGEELDGETKDRIVSLVSDLLGGNPRLHHFHYHGYGSHVELTFHMYLRGDMSIDEGHEIVEKVEDRIFEELGIYATVHVDSKRQIQECENA